MKPIYLFAIAELVFMTSCQKTDLDVRSEYYNRKSLASYQVDTPDPRKSKLYGGQRIIISWRVDQETFDEGPLELLMKVRFMCCEMAALKVDFNWIFMSCVPIHVAMGR